MTDFLLATIYAPLCSWGDIAVGEVRETRDRPSRSAVLGLVAAALGLTREAADAHAALDAGYGVAVRVDDAGTPLVDYHTVQTMPASAMRRANPATRRDMLRLGEPATIVSRRTYRQDARAVVALWARGQSRWSLQELATALAKPTFVLYAGRKASPLGMPLRPELVSASSLAAALRMRPFRIQILEDDRRPEPGRLEVAHDPCEGFSSGLVPPFRREVRRDTSPDRERWLFSERTVEVGVLQLGNVTT